MLKIAKILPRTFTCIMRFHMLYCRQEKETLWDETMRLFNPHKVYIDLSKKLFDEKQALLNQMGHGDE